jgi:hypothetical protein
VEAKKRSEFHGIKAEIETSNNFGDCEVYSFKRTFWDRFTVFKCKDAGIMVTCLFYVIFRWDSCIEYREGSYYLSFDNLSACVELAHGSMKDKDALLFENLMAFRPVPSRTSDELTIQWFSPVGSIIAYDALDMLCHFYDLKSFGESKFTYEAGNHSIAGCADPSTFLNTHRDGLTCYKERCNVMITEKFNLNPLKYLNGCSSKPNQMIDVRLTKAANLASYGQAVAYGSTTTNGCFIFTRNRFICSAFLSDIIDILYDYNLPKNLSVMSCRGDYRQKGDYMWHVKNNLGPTIFDRWAMQHVQDYKTKLVTAGLDSGKYGLLNKNIHTKRYLKQFFNYREDKGENSEWDPNPKLRPSIVARCNKDVPVEATFSIYDMDIPDDRFGLPAFVVEDFRRRLGLYSRRQSGIGESQVLQEMVEASKDVNCPHRDAISGKNRNNVLSPFPSLLPQNSCPTNTNEPPHCINATEDRKTQNNCFANADQLKAEMLKNKQTRNQELRAKLFGKGTQEE